MHLSLILRLLVLLTLANGTPVVINKVLGRRLSYPIEGGVKFVDGKPLFGSSKTIREVLYSVLETAVRPSLAGWEWNVGAAPRGVPMAVDLVSSLLKRRIGVPAH